MSSETVTVPTRLATIPTAKIRENPAALREVDKGSEKYLELVDSVKAKGILNPILVREMKDPETGEDCFGLVDGLHRYSAALDAGLEAIDCKITKMEDADVLFTQIMANVHRVETKPVEYSKQLNRILAWNPLMTKAQLAESLNKSGSWIDQMLHLVKLAEDIAALVDEGKIVLSNAYALSKLPVEEQVNYLDRASTQTPQEFVPAVTTRVKELRDAARQGRAAAPAVFEPVAHLRKVGELKQELEKPTAGPLLLAKYNVTSVADAFRLGIQFAVHMDPESVEAQRLADEQRKAKQKSEKEKRDKERLEKQQATMAKKQAELNEKLEKAGLKTVEAAA